MSDSRRRVLFVSSLVFLSIVFLFNPLTSIISRGRPAPVARIAMTGFLAPVMMAAMAGFAIAMMEILRSRADRAGLIGGTLTIIGWGAGTRILALGQLESLLASGVTPVPADTLQKMFAAAPLVFLSIVPVGILFPIGLITLGMALMIKVNRPIGALLAIGGVLFPLGRAAQLEWALHACDIVLGATFALLAWLVLALQTTWMDSL